MANRELQGGRTVGADVAVKLPDADVSTEQMFHSIAELGQNIIKENQQAKIMENFSAAQIDINQMAMKYQTEYEGDPFGGMKKFQEERDKIIEGYGNDISPFFKKPWQQDTRRLAMTNDAAMETWAYKQTKVNTVTAINRSIKNNMSQALVDGQNFGNSDEDEIGSLMNFGQSKAQLIGFADKNLGSETATKMLEDYDGDYLKSFMSGVSDSNPLKALRLMERDDVKASFKDQKQYTSMKEAIESRALNVQEINGKKQVLTALKDENSLLAKSLEAPISYADLQQQFAAQPNMSSYAKNFFMKANGYTKADGTTKLSNSEQLQFKTDLYDQITQTVSNPELDAADISALQTKVYQGMDNGSLTEKEGINYLNQITAPLADAKEAQYSKFQMGKNNPFQDNIGFSGIQQIYQDQIEVKPAEGEDEVGDQTKLMNNQNKVKLFDNYMASLTAQAASYGLTVAQVPSLGKPQQRKLYTDAQNQAVKDYMIDKNPALATLPDLPNQVLTGGKLIQGTAGDRNLKPDVAAPPKFETYSGSDGYLYRQYPDGKYERVGRMPQ
jgi:hypothetical protein